MPRLWVCGSGGGELPDSAESALVEDEGFAVSGVHLQDPGDDDDVVAAVEFVGDLAVDEGVGAADPG